MPDRLNSIYEEPKLKKQVIKISTLETQTKNCETPTDYETLQAEGLLQKDAVKIEDAISECLKSNPFFGELK